MRGDFVNALITEAERDERVVLLTGDLGFAVLEPFAERFPGRFFNCGVAEQNMVGMATGVAEAGLLPFVYSIATFAALRPYEFIRNGPALNRLPVHVVGVGGGFEYGLNGVTHFALEDIAVMRVQPEVTVVVPADADQLRKALPTIVSLDGPSYIRVSKQGAPIPGLEGKFELGRIQVLERGSEATEVGILSIGSATHIAVEVRAELEKQGIRCSQAVVSNFNPDPTDDVAEFLAGKRIAITVESHYEIGGLGSFVAEVIACNGLDVKLSRSAVAGMPASEIGSQEYLERAFGLEPAAIVEAATDALSC